MDPLNLMQQLEEGQIDVDHVLAYLRGGREASPAATPAADLADYGDPVGAEERVAPKRAGGAPRSAAGKVILAELNAPPEATAPTAPGRPRVTLAPVEPTNGARAPARAQVKAAMPGEAAARSAPTPGPKAATVETRVEARPAAPVSAVRAVGLTSSSDVVRVTFPFPSIAVVAMEDGDNRNMFSPGFIHGLQAAFAEVRRRSDTKAVVVHGYASWFCSGGTPDTLDEIRQGQATFTDTDVFRLLLDCELPTIAAMQGHALGGGLTFGLYADLLLMADHAYYAGNFMSHGFTPGVGATFLFPEKLGKVLGTEMLLTARRYRGSELRERGAQAQVVSGSEVIPRALEIAKELAEKPVPQLKLLKRRLSQAVRLGVAHAIDEELMMHRVVFQTAGWRPE